MNKLLILLLLIPIISFADANFTELVCEGAQDTIILCDGNNKNKCGVVSTENKTAYVSFDEKIKEMIFDSEKLCEIVTEDIKLEKRRVRITQNWLDLYSSFTSDKYKNNKYKSACYVHADINRSTGSMNYSVTDFVNGLSWKGKLNCKIKENKF